MKNIFLCFLIWILPLTALEPEARLNEIRVEVSSPPPSRTHTDNESTQTVPVHHSHNCCNTKVKLAVVSGLTTIATTLLIVLLKYYN